MKRFISVLAIMALMVGSFSFSMEAKTTSSTKKSTSSASVPMRQTYDGYADLTGHTYKCTYDGETLTVRFADTGYAYWTSVYKKNKNTFTSYWAYQGDGIVATYMDDGSLSVDFQIFENGKKLKMYLDGEELVMNLVK